MFDEPNESPPEDASDPAVRAKEKSDEFRMHAELFAVYEGTRKFDAGILPTLAGDLAREVQRSMGRLEKSKTPESPILPDPSKSDAAALLDFPRTHDLSTNDYHVHHRPGETVMVRWLHGEEVDAYYERFQAHYDAALEGYRDEERHSHEWKQDAATDAYLKALDTVGGIKMAERYLRPYIKEHGLYVLSTQTADEFNIAYLADYIMSVPAEEIVGAASAPPAEAPTEKDLAWFFKLFSLRGVKDGEEQMCFFTYLQKSDDSGW